MARIARVVVSGYPYHVTQRGNRRQETFFEKDDYRGPLGRQRSAPQPIGEAHRRYTRRINFREGWRGHLWQGRFPSFVMGKPYLLAAAPYVEFSPMRANLVGNVADWPAADWPWSSAKAHLLACNDRPVRVAVQVASMLAMVNDWRAFPDSAMPEEPDAEEQLRDLRNPARTGRPPGDATFVERLEKLVGRVLGPRKPGRKPMFPKQPT